MTVGDRRHARAQPILRAAHYPERPAVADVVAESLRASYSYTQHAGQLVGGWAAPRSPDSEAAVVISGGTGGTTYRVLDCETVVPQHWDRVRVVAWVAVFAFVGNEPLVLSAAVGADSDEGQLAIDSPPRFRLGPLDVLRVEAEVELATVTRDSIVSVTVDLARDLGQGTRVAALSCFAWAETDGAED